MRNWSLVGFTLLSQSAIGLVWLTVASRWIGKAAPADAAIAAMVTALGLSALGMLTALAHLCKPRLAPHAFRNLSHSWLSREVLLVQAFAAAVAAVIVLAWLRVAGGWMLLEASACLLGAGALFAMSRVYMLRTVPVWNSPATCLEFSGSALLLGGSVKALLVSVPGNMTPPARRPEMVVCGIAIAAGILLKLSAIPPALAAAKAARNQTWCASGAVPLVAGGILAVRTALYLAGLIPVLTILGGMGPMWLLSLLAAACFVVAEVVGRNRFYRSYRRVGL